MNATYVTDASTEKADVEVLYRTVPYRTAHVATDAPISIVHNIVVPRLIRNKSLPINLTEMTEK